MITQKKEDYKTCPRCMGEFALSYYTDSSLRACNYRCRDCESSRKKKYHNIPGVRKRIRRSSREYSQRPEVKKRVKIYRQRQEYKEYAKDYSNRPERKANRLAKDAVNYEVRNGRMPRASELRCECGDQAEQYHHPSYKKEHRLDVIPYCRPCHAKIHRL